MAEEETRSLRGQVIPGRHSEASSACQGRRRVEFYISRAGTSGSRAAWRRRKRDWETVATAGAATDLVSGRVGVGPLRLGGGGNEIETAAAPTLVQALVVCRPREEELPTRRGGGGNEAGKRQLVPVTH